MPSWFFCSSDVPHPKPPSMSPTTTLLHFQPGSTPPSARVGPKLKLQPRPPLRIWDYWKIAPFLAAKATEVTSDVLSHHIWGPRRKTWGIEMTIINSLIRGANRHIELVDIGTIRLLMSLLGLVPVPSDALVTPASFKVKRRNLRGLLADLDVKEDGGRELSGEWVVGRKTWQRMQKEWKASTSPSRPSQTSSTSHTSKLPKKKELVVLYIHGGAYYLSSAAAMRLITIPLAKYTDSRVFALDYRLAPETRFPGPLHDVVAAYFRLVDELRIPPENIIIGGDSAGGGLSLALLMYLRDNSYPLPSGAILMSPWVDLTMSCESWETNAPYDVVPLPLENHMNPIALYLGEKAEKYLTHPYASPLFGDFTGLPPLLIQAGDAEVLRDESRLLAHKATSAGVQVMYELYDDAVHVFQAYPFVEASRRSFESMHAFVRIVLPRHWTRSPQLLATATELGLEQEMENDRTVVVGGDGTEQASSRSKQSQMEAFAESQQCQTGSSGDEASWVPSPVGHKSSKPRMEEDRVDYLDMEGDIPELELSPSLSFFKTPSAPLSPPNNNLTFTPNPSPMLYRPSSQPLLSISSDSSRDLRRIHSTNSLAAKVTLHVEDAEQSTACPTPPPTTYPPSSPVHTFHLSFISPSPRLNHQPHRRSKSSTQLSQLFASDQCIYPPYSPSPPWTMSRLMMTSRKKYFTESEVLSLQA